jgi:hypothetical protein
MRALAILVAAALISSGVAMFSGPVTAVLVFLNIALSSYKIKSRIGVERAIVLYGSALVAGLIFALFGMPNMGELTLSITLLLNILISRQ